MNTNFHGGGGAFVERKSGESASDYLVCPFMLLQLCNVLILLFCNSNSHIDINCNNSKCSNTPLVLFIFDKTCHVQFLK